MHRVPTEGPPDGVGEGLGAGTVTGGGGGVVKGQTVPEPGGTFTSNSRPEAQPPGAWLVSQNCAQTGSC